MRKAIIACFAIAFLTSPLHAESAGSAALRGGVKGAGSGAGGGAGSGGTGCQNDPCQQFQQILNQLTQGQAIKPSTGPKGAGSTGGIKGAGAVAGTQMKATSTTSGSSQTKGRR
jgi:hypothetical protein